MGLPPLGEGAGAEAGLLGEGAGRGLGAPVLAALPLSLPLPPAVPAMIPIAQMTRTAPIQQRRRLFFTEAGSPPDMACVWRTSSAEGMVLPSSLATSRSTSAIDGEVSSFLMVGYVLL